MILEQGFQALRIGGQAVARLEIAVVKRQGVVGEVEQGDIAAGRARGVGGDGDEFAVPRVAADAAREGENFRHVRHVWLQFKSFVHAARSKLITSLASSASISTAVSPTAATASPASSG